MPNQHKFFDFYIDKFRPTAEIVNKDYNKTFRLASTINDDFIMDNVSYKQGKDNKISEDINYSHQNFTPLSGASFSWPYMCY